MPRRAGHFDRVMDKLLTRNKCLEIEAVRHSVHDKSRANLLPEDARMIARGAAGPYANFMALVWLTREIIAPI